MDTILAEQGLRLSYLRDPSSNETFDPCHILDDLSEAGDACAMLPWQNAFRMVESDHLVLATGCDNGRCIGVLAASDLATEREPFLFLDAAFIAPVADTSHLLQRMLAFAMLRIAGPASVPNMLAACVQTPSYARGLREFGQRFSAASLFPVARDAVVVDLGMASLARRIGRAVRPGSHYEAATGALRSSAVTDGAYHPGRSHRMEETLVVVDLSAADDASILDDALKLYRSRLARGTRRGFADAVANAGSNARRRLRDATAL